MTTIYYKDGKTESAKDVKDAQMKVWIRGVEMCKYIKHKGISFNIDEVWKK